jgi:hypothetical protein
MIEKAKRESDTSELEEVEISHPQLTKLDSSLLLIFCTASAHVYAYFWQKSYLQYFMIDETLVYVDIQALLAAGSTFLVGSATIWYLFSNFRVSWIKFLLLLMISYQFSWFLGFVSISMIYFGGFSWISIILAIVFVLVFSVDTFTLVSDLRKAGSLSGAWDQAVRFSRDYRQGTVEGSLDKLFGSHNMNLILIVVLVPYFLGAFLGERFAERKKDFLSFQDANSEYLIVYNQGDSTFAVGYTRDPATQVLTLSDRVRVLKPTEMEKRELTYFSNVTVKHKEKSTARITFSQFWEANFGTPQVENRRP